jgi:ADP-ribosyl-[dinitrogen reductase] hydrolase
MEKKITLNALRKNKTSLSNICLNAAAPIAIVSVMSTNASHHINTLATRITRLTQPHPAAVDAVRVLATAIRSLVLSPDSQLAFDSALKAARTPLVREHLTQSRVRPHPQPENELDDSELPIDYIGITLQNAFYHLRHARSYSEGVIAAIQGGGDTTTNAAVTGALLGARFGVNGIPSAWKNTCVKTRLDRHNVFPDVQLSDLSEVVHRLISKVSL